MGPSLMPVAQLLTVCAAAFSATSGSAPLVNVGASLTGDVIVNDCVGLSSVDPPPLSWAWSMTVEEPFAFAAGV